MRYEVRRKALVKCKIPGENGRYSEHSETEMRELSSDEAIEQWAKESCLDAEVPRALHLEDCLKLLQEHFSISREPAWRRVMYAMKGSYIRPSPLSIEKRGRFRFIAYHSERLKGPVKEPTEEELRQAEELKRKRIEEALREDTMSPYERALRQMERNGELTPPIHAKPKAPEEKVIDIFEMLEAHSKKRKEEAENLT